MQDDTLQDHKLANLDTKYDYVITVDRRITTIKHFTHIKKFIQQIQDLGIEVEINNGKIEENIYFCVKLRQKTIEHFAQIYDINIQNPGHNYIPTTSTSWNFLRTPLSKNDIFKRQGQEVTNMERILICYEVMNEAKFGDGENEYGIATLVNKKAVAGAFPLHDGPFDYEGVNEELLNDRQLLSKYWANFGLWYKEQPLNLIEKYYGSEVAFYFAWLGFYNKMLIPAAIFGLIVFIISIVHLLTMENQRVDDICSSEKIMCPLCHGADFCVSKPLNSSCTSANLIVLFDNYATVGFAVFMSFWATLFLNLWRRLENVLKIRWNVTDLEVETKARLQYREKAKHRKLSIVTGELEPYITVEEKVKTLVLTYATCLLIVAVITFAMFGVIMYSIIFGALVRGYTDGALETFLTLVVYSLAAIFQVLLIKLFGKYYVQLSEWLTRLENPRTQSEFDNAVVHKRYFLGFVNNYTPLFYYAFFKGRFYSPVHRPSMFSIETDVCHPCGCLMAVCNQLFFILVLKSLIGNIITILAPKIRRKFKKKLSDTPKWEEEYLLQPAGRSHLTTEFMEMIIQYGFVTFFVAAFPLAPLFALIINCMELRLDAVKLVTQYRRPLPIRQSGIGPWYGILQAITHLSIATNAFVLAFTSDFVAREIYKYQHNNTLDGYIESTLSTYDMSDGKGTICYYKALRYPPKHPRKYQLMPQYWYEVGMRLLCVIVFEHVIWVSNGILSYAIPDVPSQVKQKLHHERVLERELKLKVSAINKQKTRKRKNARQNKDT